MSLWMFQQDYRIPVWVHSLAMIVIAGYLVTSAFVDFLYLKSVSWLAGDRSDFCRHLV